MQRYIRLEIIRSLRDPLYLCLAVAAPIGFYLLFTAIFGNTPQPPHTLASVIAQMVSMAVYGGMWACLVATGPRLASERGNGWLRNAHLLPIAPWKMLVGRTIAAISFALPAIMLVCLTAVIAHKVDLTPGQWIGVIFCTWVGVWPFAILGIAIGALVSSDAAFGITYGIYTVLSALGGLWVPLVIFPSQLQTIGKALPSYNVAALGWRIAHAEAPTWSSIFTILIWAVFFTVAALILTPRAARSR